MSNTDFFDDDLHKPPPPAEPVAPAPEPADTGRIRDPGMARISRHRDQLESQVATAAKEIERLRQKQEDLEAERRSLEEIRRKQDEYLRSKKAIVQKLNQSLYSLEREEVKATQLVDLYTSTRRSFRTLLDDVQSVDETAWEKDRLGEEVTHALDRVSAVRVEVAKSLARLDAMGGTSAVEGQGEGAEGADGAASKPSGHGFGHWVKVGFAVGLPVALLVGLVLALLAFLLPYLILPAK